MSLSIGTITFSPLSGGRFRTSDGKITRRPKEYALSIFRQQQARKRPGIFNRKPIELPTTTVRAGGIWRCTKCGHKNHVPYGKDGPWKTPFVGVCTGGKNYDDRCLTKHLIRQGCTEKVPRNKRNRFRRHGAPIP